MQSNYFTVFIFSFLSFFSFLFTSCITNNNENDDQNVPDIIDIPIVDIPSEKPKEPEKQPEKDVIIELLSEMNAERAKVNAPALVIDSGLTCAARTHSNDIGIRKVCTHTGVNGSTPWDRARFCQVEAYGEIVACGQKTPKEAVLSWYYSPGHKKIMLDKNFKKVGIAVTNYYWTAIFSY